MIGLVACAGSDPEPVDPEPDPDRDDETVDDASRFRDLVAGAASLAETRDTIAASGGFPVRVSGDTWLFLVDGDGWRLAGDHNGWEPAAMNAGDGFSWAEVTIPDPAGAIYKFVSTDGVYVADPWARSYGYDSFGEYSLVAPAPDAARLDRWPGVSDGVLPARTLRVYVPAGVGPWPVLYAHDGQNLFDPGAFWGGWHLQDAAAATSGVLIVGIDNTADRMTEYTHVDDVIDGATFVAAGDAYAGLIVDAVKPLVEAEYGSTGHDGLLGSSLGGLISLAVAHRSPTTFDFAGSMSGTLGWGRFGAGNPTIGELYQDAGVRGFAVYVDSGGSDGGDGCTDPDGDGFPFDDPNDGDNYCANRWFADAMAAEGYVYGDDLVHWHEAGATHDEAAWAARVGRPLDLFLSLAD